MRHLRTASTTRIVTLLAAVVALVLSAGFAQAALTRTPSPTRSRSTARSSTRSTRPTVSGVSARVTFTNGLLPTGSLPDGAVSPLAEGAEGRLWVAGDGRMRLELQSAAGDAQIVAGEDRVTIYDSSSETAYVLPIKHQEPKEHEPATLAGVRNGLDRLAETWSLSGAQPTSTAGRPTYTVRSRPRTTAACSAPPSWPGTRSTAPRCAPPSTRRARTSPCSSSRRPTSPTAPSPARPSRRTRPRARASSRSIPRPAARTRTPPDHRARRRRRPGADTIVELSAPKELAGLPRTGRPPRERRRRARALQRLRRGHGRHPRPAERGRA